MRYWLIRDDVSSVAVDRRDYSISIKSTRKPRIEMGDILVYLKSNKEFSRTAKVSSIVQPDVFRQEQLSVTSIKVSEQTELPEPLTVDMLKYSLTFVRNFRKPYLHFRRGYRALSKVDYETIVSGELFVARSCYYELLDTLPRQMRAIFEAQELLTREEMIISDSFADRASRLYEFIKTRILSVGSIVQRIETAILDVGLGNVDGLDVIHEWVDEIADGNTAVTAGDDVRAQARLFGEADRLLRSPVSEIGEAESGDVIMQTLQDLSLPEIRRSEQRFERIFRGFV